MDTAIIIFGVIGIILFGAYIFFIIKTSHDDQKEKNKKNISLNGSD